MQKQSFCGVADARILRFGVHSDSRGLIDVREFIDVNVADAVGMSQHWNLRALLDHSHHFIGPAGNHEIDQIIHFEQVCDLFAC